MKAKAQEQRRLKSKVSNAPNKRSSTSMLYDSTMKMEKEIKLKPEVLCLHSVDSFMLLLLPFSLQTIHFFVRFFVVRVHVSEWSRWLTNRRPWKLSRLCLCLWMNNMFWMKHRGRSTTALTSHCVWSGTHVHNVLSNIVNAWFAYTSVYIQHKRNYT